MVSLVIICPGPWPRTKYTAIVRWQPPARKTRHPAQADSDEPDASRADAQVVGRRFGIGVEYEAEQAQTKDGAGGGPAEERTCARGRGVRLSEIAVDSKQQTAISAFIAQQSRAEPSLINLFVSPTSISIRLSAT